MKIILVHNYYQQAGGEDSVVAAERRMLEEQGHQVVPYYKDNQALGTGLRALGKAGLQTLWNWEIYREFRELLKSEKPDVIHCHNTFPLISPSVYWACAKENIPVVQTLHNYRLLCLNAFLFKHRSGLKCKGLSVKQKKNVELNHLKSNTVAGYGICELCLKKGFKYPGIKYCCYRDSFAGSLVVALMLFVHKLIGTWSKKITAYIVLTEFQKQKMVEGGLPAEKIFVKANFIQDEDNHEKDEVHEKSADVFVSSVVKETYCLFVGRLSPEKGCDVLLKAWAHFQEKLSASSHRPIANDARLQLIIVGDGPERDSLECLANSDKLTANIHFLGRRPKNEVLQLMQKAEFLVSPSVCYETFGLVVLEAGMRGTPSVVGEPGTVAALIIDSKTGLLFPMGDELQLANKIEWAFDRPKEMQKMGKDARKLFKEKYSAEVNCRMLVNVYGQARDTKF